MAMISLLTLVLLWKSPRSAKLISDAEIEPPLSLSSISSVAVRVYTDGVLSRYMTATPMHTARDRTNHFHLDKYRNIKSFIFILSS